MLRKLITFNLICWASLSQALAENDLRIITKEQWEGQPSRGSMNDLQLPVSKVIIIHTATPPCKTIAECNSRVRSIQNYHMENRKFSDIAYNFLIGDDGSIYEGRQWQFQGAHTKNHNQDSVGIALIGTFVSETPTEAQLNAVKGLLKKGVDEGKLSANYKLYGHRQLRATESPGELLFEIIKTWPHWCAEV